MSLELALRIYFFLGFSCVYSVVVFEKYAWDQICKTWVEDKITCLMGLLLLVITWPILAIGYLYEFLSGKKTGA